MMHVKMTLGADTFDVEGSFGLTDYGFVRLAQAFLEAHSGRLDQAAVDRLTAKLEDQTAEEAAAVGENTPATTNG